MRYSRDSNDSAMHLLISGKGCEKPLLLSPGTSSPEQPLAGLLPALSRPFLWLPNLPALVPGRVTFLDISVATPGLEISLHLRADHLHDAVGGLSRRYTLACRQLSRKFCALPGTILWSPLGGSTFQERSQPLAGCPAALPALPCGKVVSEGPWLLSGSLWPLYASVRTRAWAKGSQVSLGSCWCFSWVYSTLGLLCTLSH